MIIDILFYVATYISLFVSIFWLFVYFTTDEKIKKLKKYDPLTIIIPTFNRAKLISKTILSLEKQNYPKLKILVIDDGSTDNTTNVVKGLMKKYRNIKYFKKKNTGKASSLNFGLEKVTSPYFGFIDSDTYVGKNVLYKMMSSFRENVACVTTGIKPSETKNLLGKIQKIEYAIATLTRKLMSAINALYYTPAFAIYKTDVIKKLKGFDEKNITEDLEIGFRLKSKNYNICNSMNSFVYTDVPKSFAELFNQRMRWYRGHIYNTKKYSKSIFGKNFWDMGIVIIIFHYLLLPFTSILLLYGLFNFLLSIIKNATDLFLIGFDFSYMTNNFVFSLLTPTTFFTVSLILFFAAILKISEKNIEGGVNKIEYPFYVIFYSFLNVFFWGSAFLHEIFKTKKRW